MHGKLQGTKAFFLPSYAVILVLFPTVNLEGLKLSFSFNIETWLYIVSLLEFTLLESFHPF